MKRLVRLCTKLALIGILALAMVPAPAGAATLPTPASTAIGGFNIPVAAGEHRSTHHLLAPDRLCGKTDAQVACDVTVTIWTKAQQGANGQVIDPEIDAQACGNFGLWCFEQDTSFGYVDMAYSWANWTSCANWGVTDGSGGVNSCTTSYDNPPDEWTTVAEEDFWVNQGGSTWGGWQKVYFNADGSWAHYCQGTGAGGTCSPQY